MTTSQPLYSCALGVEQERPTELNLHTHLISNQASTFIVQAQENYLHAPYVYRGDLLVVDRSLQASSQHLVLAVVDFQFIVHHLGSLRRAIPNDEIMVWGVVTHVIHSTSSRS